MMIAMPAAIAERRTFALGTTGWDVDALDDPVIERRWFRGRYEIVEGVLTTLPPAYIDEGLPLGAMVHAVNFYLFEKGLPGDIVYGVDFVLARRRVVRVDAVFVTPDDLRRPSGGKCSAWSP